MTQTLYAHINKRKNVSLLIYKCKACLHMVFRLNLNPPCEELKTIQRNYTDQNREMPERAVKMRIPFSRIMRAEKSIDQVHNAFKHGKHKILNQKVLLYNI
jgi:hypothetical protein